MNDSILNQLKQHVERSVRPLNIGQLRKRQIREEMLTHIIGIYEEEFAKRADEKAALTSALQRFGDPTDLTAELQQSITFSDRFAGVMDRLRLLPGESYPHLLGKHLIAASSVFGLEFLLFFCVELLKNRDLDVLKVGLPFFAMLSIAVAVSGSIFVWSSRKISEVRFLDQSRGARRSLIGPCLIGLLPFPLMVTILYWGLGLLFPPPNMLLAACLLSPLIPSGALLVSKQVAEGIRHEREWAALKLEPDA